MFGSKTREVVQVIQWENPNPDHIVYRWPGGEVQFPNRLIVRGAQKAIFFRDGKALDTFGQGDHELTTANVPILQDFLKKFTGGVSIFQAEVYFIDTKTFTDLKWGTPNPIDLKDPDLGWVQLRAFGTFSVRVTDPQVFLNELVGVQQLYTAQSLNQYLKGSLRTHLNDLIGTTFESYAKIRSELQELSAAMKVKVRNDFGKYGIELVDFFIQDVSVPEEIQEAFRLRAKMGALGVQNYTQFQAANAMVEMAKNPGSGGAAMNAGMGMGMGMMFPQMMAGQMGYPPPGYPPPGYPPQGYGYPPPGYPPQGYPPQGYPPQGYPPQGQPPQGQGYPPQGYPPQGQGYPPPGAPPEGAPPQGGGAPPAVETQACPQCQAGNPQGARFCYNCGYQFQPPGVAPAAPPQ